MGQSIKFAFRILEPSAGSVAAWSQSVFGAKMVFIFFQNAGMGGWAAGMMNTVVRGVSGTTGLGAEMAKNGTMAAT
ncbi:hypothetical protein LTS10_003894 [Elasticomyces elasticus]|nr:hypothetical protein LTS10_003894 [Elasticomyces elasticus]